MVSNLGFSVLRSAVVVSLTAALVGLWLILSPAQSHACSCMAPGSPREALATSDAVFRGTITSLAFTVEHYEDPPGSYERLGMEFNVHTYWKGPQYQTLYVVTNFDGEACGLEPDPSIGEEYLVYAFRSDSGALGTGLCSRTTLAAYAEDELAELGSGRTPIPGVMETQSLEFPTAFKPRTESDSRSGSDCGLSLLAIFGAGFAGTIAGAAALAGGWFALRKRRPESI